MIAKIAVERAAFRFDKLFDYEIPPELLGAVERGRRVLVPFGAGEKRRQGMVFALADTPETPDAKLKSVRMVLDGEPVLPEELLALGEHLAERTFCPLFEAVKAMLPPGLNYKPVYRFRTAPSLDETALSDEELRVVQFLRGRKNAADGKTLMQTFGLNNLSFFNELSARGILEKTEAARRAVGDETLRMARLTQETSLLLENGEKLPFKATPKQREVLEFLNENGPVCVKEIGYYTAAGPAVVETLVQKGAAEYFEQPSFRTPYKNAKKTMDASEIVLSEEQQAAYEGIHALCGTGETSASLLFGVTGSGKTQVFMKLIDAEMKAGRQVILMVPEISLTPQMIGRFIACFGREVAVMHSALSAGERIDEWKRIRSGRAKIVIGTRSAVFAPAPNLGLIILDEEQEQSYKSDRSPRFHARDAAAFRCAKLGIPLLLASATPSIETFYKAKEGKIRLFEMAERYGGAKLPDTVIVDMNAENHEGNTGVLSEGLARELKWNLEHGQQSILLMNRRGYNTIARCMQCNTVKACPRCDIPLIYHKANGRLMCHYCGYSEPASIRCDACGSEYVMYSGCGTQKVEDELHRDFPEARILRMDLDTTMARYSHDRYFTEFAEGKYDIMVGTQMVAKGLDFPEVTLVGVLAADMSLYGGDYRSYERTFGLLTQVIGRCGRAGLSGRAYIQTYSPEHSVLIRASAQDYRAFYEDEILNRRVMLYPPYCAMGSVLFSGEKEAEVREAAEAFSAMFGERLKAADLPARLLGPTPSRVPKVAGKWRWKLIMKYRPDGAFFRVAAEALKAFAKESRYGKVEISVDPSDIG